MAFWEVRCYERVQARNVPSSNVFHGNERRLLLKSVCFGC